MFPTDQGAAFRLLSLSTQKSRTQIYSMYNGRRQRKAAKTTSSPISEAGTLETVNSLCKLLQVKGIKEQDLLVAACKYDIQHSKSPAQRTHASAGPTCLQSGNWSLCFYRVPPLTPCALLLAGGHTPLPKG